MVVILLSFLYKKYGVSLWLSEEYGVSTWLSEELDSHSLVKCMVQNSYVGAALSAVVVKATTLFLKNSGATI